MSQSIFTTPKLQIGVNNKMQPRYLVSNWNSKNLVFSKCLNERFKFSKGILSKFCVGDLIFQNYRNNYKQQEIRTQVRINRKKEVRK